MAVPVERRMKRRQEQRWILDNIIRTAGIEWDQPRIAPMASERIPHGRDWPPIRQVGLRSTRGQSGGKPRVTVTRRRA